MFGSVRPGDLTHSDRSSFWINRCMNECLLNFEKTRTPLPAQYQTPVKKFGNLYVNLLKLTNKNQ
ncbi:hypothetical protein [Rhabdaerophilum sp. SD176]|uniref:hypothetical protein n=1 Tax=Rhabdaerophilum sp. SD176 TaxID=2983548 RepID=UPI0024DF4402|nr:hypothetical protein [Rhabdaerophilum sp. SD176]